MSDKIDNHLLNYSNFQWSAVFTDTVYFSGEAQVSGERCPGDKCPVTSAHGLFSPHAICLHKGILSTPLLNMNADSTQAGFQSSLELLDCRAHCLTVVK